MKKKISKENSLELVFTETKEALSVQIETIDHFGNKAGIIVGFIGAIIGIVLGLEYSRTCLYYDGIVLLMISLLLAIMGLRAGKYRRDPKPRGFRDEYIDELPSETMRTLINHFVDSYEENKDKIKELSKYLNWSLYFMFSGLILITLSIL